MYEFVENSNGEKEDYPSFVLHIFIAKHNFGGDFGKNLKN